jgi:uncharacterized membrane protein YsdA (DUF1294 family)/cold shock CspA family protein
MSLKGRIAEWSQERGFGYLEYEGKRVFLHWREFKEHHKRPEVDDVILFTLGEDKQGRACAKEAMHANDGGRLRGVHLLILLALLALPTIAVARTQRPRPGWGLAAWFLLASALTYWRYHSDKRKARAKEWRVAESTLHIMEIMGGWPGAFLAQRILRHKASKGSYQFIFIVIIGLYQFAAIDALRGWPIVQSLLRR